MTLVAQLEDDCAVLRNQASAMSAVSAECAHPAASPLCFYLRAEVCHAVMGSIGGPFLCLAQVAERDATIEQLQQQVDAAACPPSDQKVD